ncbi:MAG: hypothetical protein ACLR50_15585 [Segatella copri]|jgi:hypothetical protein
MPAKTNTVMAADIQTTAREIDFVTRFGRNWEHLRDIMGVSRKIEMLPNTVLKSKYAQGTLQDGKVGEGEEIPYSKYTVKTKDYEKITLEKWAKGTTAEAILEDGYENAVQMTDEEMLNDLTADVAGRFYKYLNTGTLKGTSKTFQEAMAMAKGRVLNKFKTMHRTATDVVAFVNVLDVYEYLGTSAVINEQSEFGFNYIKNFMGYKTVFLLAETEIARGKVIATPADNIVLYYVNPTNSDWARAGFRLTTDSNTGIVGVNTRPDYGTFVTVITAVMGMTLFAEYIDGIAVETITPGESV